MKCPTTEQIATELKDLGNFSIPCTVGNFNFSNALCDQYASVSLMPLSMAKKLGLIGFKKADMTL